MNDPQEFNLDAEGGSDAAAGLYDRIAALEAELEEAKARSLRQMADFQNYQRRALQNEQVAKQQGMGSVASGVVGVIDHLDLALAQDTDKASVQQIVTGVRVIRDELMKSLQQHGVGVISPAPNEEFVPGRHEAIMQQALPGIAPGHVSSTLQAGYTLGDRVLRPAKVAVAPSE